MEQGYIKLFRKILDNALWKGKPFDKGKAWVDLVLLANHKDGGYFLRGIWVEVRRGEVGWSQIRLAKRWGWSREKIRRFLKHLKNESQTAQRTIQQNKYLTSIIIIVNYEEYQGNETANETASVTADEQQKDSKRGSNKNEKNEKNEKKKTIAIPDWVPQEAWDGFVEMRKKIRAPLSDHAITLVLKKLLVFKEKGFDPNEILNKSTMNSWKGLFEPKDKGTSTTEHNLKVLNEL